MQLQIWVLHCVVSVLLRVTALDGELVDWFMGFQLLCC